MVMRELSYVLHRDPATGADRLSPVTAVPDGVPEDLLEHVIVATHPGSPVTGAALSYTRLPHRDGGALLCSARPDHTATGLRIDARYTAGDPGGGWARWPVDAWRPHTEDAEGDGPFAAADQRWGTERLTEFARHHADRVSCFLTDVRGLFENPAGRQIVVAEHDQETVACWIALACASLPAAYARSLTFTTRTADPAGAPQQILGIGPEAEAVFDRCDDLTRTHLFRVHDGLGGPGSPPRVDPWAALAAWLWLHGVPPQPGGDGAGRGEAPGAVPDASFPSAARTAPSVADAFAVPPLVRRALARRDLSWDVLASHPDDVLAEIVAALAAVADHDPLDTEDAVLTLTQACDEIGGQRRDAVQPLALALAGRRLRQAGPRDVEPALQTCADLPLDDEARSALRAEYGPRPEQALSELLGRSFDTWEVPLRALLRSGDDRGPVVEKAVSTLARALCKPDQRQARADAVALLEALDHGGFTRQVLEMVAQDSREHRIRALGDLAASEHGSWLRAQADGAPLAVRLAVEVAALRAAPPYPRGADVLLRVAERLPGGRVSDGETLRILWQLIFPAGQPGREDQSKVTQVCSAELIVEAGWEVRLTHWLKHPGEITRELFDFARATLRFKRLGPSEQATAELLALAQDMAHGRQPVGSAVERVRALEQETGPMDVTLRDGIDQLIAESFARTDPVRLFDSPDALRYLAAGGMGLHRHYHRAAVEESRRQGGVLSPHALHTPQRLARLFVIWRVSQEDADNGWKKTADGLLDEVFGPLLPRLEDRFLGEVAAFLGRDASRRWAEEWNAWCRHRTGRGYV
ncbi:GTPase-associated protein 1-related protein [Streptomyces sp. NPDC002787]